jgi:nucleotide-binding universal stress UspA family protein
MTEKPYIIVVGVSGTSKSSAALEWASAQARRNQGRIIAVRAWRMPNPQATPSGTPAGRIPREQDVEQLAHETLQQDVASVLGADHQAELRLVRGGKFQVLLKAAAEADLLVVDAPRQLFAGPMFAHRLIYAASCPVLVMPPRVSDEPPSILTRVAGAVGRSVVTAAGTAGRPGYRPPPLA